MIKSVDWKKVEEDEKNKSFSTINDAVIIGCDIEMYPQCTNKKCCRKITPPPNETRFSCQCGQRLDSAYLRVGFSGKIDVENENDDVELTFHPDVLKPLFGDDFVQQYFEKKLALQDKVMDLTKRNAKITYSKAKKEVTNIELNQ